jgi:hypothetical protein
MANHFAFAMFTNRRNRLNRAFKAVKCMPRAGSSQFERQAYPSVLHSRSEPGSHGCSEENAYSDSQPRWRTKADRERTEKVLPPSKFFKVIHLRREHLVHVSNAD